MYDIQSIRRANPITDVIANSGVDLRRLSQRLIGRCPFHTDAQPSLVVYPKDASYFCFGCSAGGDVIDFVSRLNGVGFRAAISMLSAASVEPRRRDDTRIAEIPSRFRAGPPTEAELRVIDAAAAFYHESLWCSPGALSYLALRGIDRRTAKESQVGYGSPGLAQHLRNRGLSLEAARGVGLLSGKWETMLGRIIIADMRDGRATWLTGRTLGEATPRYMNLRLPTPLLGLVSVRREEAVILAEGVFDWLTLVQWGFPAVALLGTRVSKHTVETLRRFSHVYVALDSDYAGRRASAELASAFGGRATIVELPAGVHDLNDLGRSTGGRQAFERCLEIATKGKDNKWKRTEEPTARRAA
jgi:DNA primase (bacterial type)